LTRIGPYAKRDDEVLAAWRSGIAALAPCRNVHLKLGGIGMPRMGFDRHRRDKPIGSEELAASMVPLMSYCIEQLGPERCMFESNFPVHKVSFSHHVLFNAFKRFSKGYSPNARAQSRCQRVDNGSHFRESSIGVRQRAFVVPALGRDSGLHPTALAG
jgi:predicted TIM-barrel fold metal-dependent hydrolase